MVGVAGRQAAVNQFGSGGAEAGDSSGQREARQLTAVQQLADAIRCAAEAAAKGRQAQAGKLFVRCLNTLQARLPVGGGGVGAGMELQAQGLRSGHHLEAVDGWGQGGWWLGADGQQVRLFRRQVLPAGGCKGGHGGLEGLHAVCRLLRRAALEQRLAVFSKLQRCQVEAGCLDTDAAGLKQPQQRLRQAQVQQRGKGAALPHAG